MRHVGHVGCLQFSGQLTLPFVAPVLKPNLHLRLSKAQGGRQAGTLRGAEVTLQIERGLQLEDLSTGEDRAGFLLTLRPTAIAMWR